MWISAELCKDRWNLLPRPHHLRTHPRPHNMAERHQGLSEHRLNIKKGGSMEYVSRKFYF